ncbi:MAG TPA: transposase [Pseudonocardiaceae bacterium]|nr:transposase [Pseudonocardiaceae bacterium]
MTKTGERRYYESVYLRRSFRDGTKVRHETLANLSALPAEAVSAVEAVLAGVGLVPGGQAVRLGRALRHGDVAAVAAQARALGFPALLGPACRERDLVWALIVSRVVKPESKLATVSAWADSTVGADLDVAGASTNEVYAAMDWLSGRQDDIEAKLALRHLSEASNPSRMALFDLSSSWVEGTHCPLAARGHSRDGKKGKLQIEYGLLTDPAGRPVAIRVFAGNTADPTAFIDAVEVVGEKFGLRDLVMVGDRGMLTSARIEALKELGGIGWLTALRAPAIARLAAEDGPLRLSLFDHQDLAEISHPGYPGERLIACRNPLLAIERARKRSELLTVTEAGLAPIAAAAAEGRLIGADQIGLRVGKVIGKYKMAKHFDLAITDTTLTATRRGAHIEAQAALDGISVIRTSVTADTLDAPEVVSAYKALARVERDFRSMKADDLDLRPIHHHLQDRVRAHVLLCMLACYLVWHLRRAWAELTYTDETPPTPDNPVAHATRFTQAEDKARRHIDTAGNPLRSFRGLLDHLATLTRHQVRFADTEHAVPMLTELTPTQRRAFELISQPIPLTLR